MTMMATTPPTRIPPVLMYRKIETGFTYDADGIVTSYEYITTYAYDTSGNVTEVDGPLAGDQDKVTYTYDTNTGDRLTETPALGGDHLFYLRYRRECNDGDGSRRCCHDLHLRR